MARMVREETHRGRLNAAKRERPGWHGVAEWTVFPLMSINDIRKVHPNMCEEEEGEGKGRL